MYIESKVKSSQHNLNCTKRESHLWLKLSIYIYFGWKIIIIFKFLISLTRIQGKVLRLVAELKENGNYMEPVELFTASKGWFHCS